MTTPPQKLLAAMEHTAHLAGWNYQSLIEVWDERSKPVRTVTLLEGVALAIRGRHEGVGPRSGRIKALRDLPAKILEEMDEAERVEKKIQDSRSTAFAQTGLGAYREKLRRLVVEETVHGHRFVAEEGELQGFVWSHCCHARMSL